MSRGISKITIPDDMVEDFYKGILDPNIFNLRVNEYVVVRARGGEVMALNKVKESPQGLAFKDIQKLTIGRGKDIFSPKNTEQKFYFDLLNDDSVTIKVCTGMAGTGKTKCALKFGMNKIADKDSPIEKIVLVRTPSGVGKEVGYFKGDKDTKLLNWNSPARDNLENESMSTFEELVEKGVIELDIPYTMQGRDIKNAWIVVDEAQNLTCEEFKMLGERVSDGSVIIYTGDLNQTCDPKAKGINNGLLRAFHLRGLPEFGCVELVEGVRSRTSEIFATMY